MLWLFWGCSLLGACVVTYLVLVELCVLGPALLGGHWSPEDEGGFLLVFLKRTSSWYKNNPSPQDARSCLLLELERSGQAGDVRAQTLGRGHCGDQTQSSCVVHGLWWRRLCAETGTAVCKPSRLRCCIRGPRCCGIQAGSVPLGNAMAKAIKPPRDARSWLCKEWYCYWWFFIN